MKYLLVLVVVVFMAWLLLGRRSGRGRSDADEGQAPDGAAPRSKDGPSRATPLMVHCAHCGVHLPDSEALVSAQGQRYCNEAHRIAGPR